MAINRKFITEVLDDINADPSKLSTDYKDNQALKIIFEYAFLTNKKFDLPEGEPPFKRDAAPIGMSPGNLMMELRRFYIFTPERELPKFKKEALFVQLLESVHPSEAKLLVAIKDQNLSSLYPNITTDVLIQNGYLPQDGQLIDQKRSRGRVRKNS